MYRKLSWPQNPLWQSFVITFLLFALSYLFIGWWTDAYQHYFDTALSGELTNYYLPAAHNPFPEYMPGAAYVLNRLGHLAPVRWVAFFLNGVLFVSIWILFNHILVYSKGFSRTSRWVLLAFFALLFFESVVLYHMVRITMFAGIAAVSFLITGNETKILSKRALPYLLLFVVALWIRCNVHLFILVFVTAVFVVHKKSLKPLIPFWLLFVAFFLFYCKIVFWTDYSKDLNSYFLYNTEFKLYFVGKYTPHLNLSQPLDSIKYLAVKHDILGDEKNLGIDFYERIGIFSNLSKFSFAQVQYAYHTFVSAVIENIYFIVADLLLIFGYILLGGNQLHGFKKKTFGMFLFFYLIVFAICFIKMENRFLVPFQVLFLFTIIKLHRPKLFSEKANTRYLIAFAAIIFPVSIYFIHHKIEFSKNNTKVFKDAMELLRKKYADETLVFNTVYVSYNRPFETFYQRNYFKNFYVFNYYATQFSPTYRPYLEEQCNCNVSELHSFYDYLTKNGNSAVLIDNAERIKVLDDYLYEVYNKKFVFEQIDSTQLRSFRFKNDIFLLSAKKQIP